MLYVEKELNSIIFNEKEFHPKKNYLPELVLALRELNKEKTIHFVIDIKKAPMLFIMYFRRLRQMMTELDLELYFKDTSEILQEVCKTYKLNYKEIDQYPWELPKEENVSGVKDPYADIKGINDPVVIEAIKAQARDREQNVESLGHIPDIYYLGES